MHEGYPHLEWRGKQEILQFDSCTAELREEYGSGAYGTVNRIYEGDNLPVLGALLKEYRGQIMIAYLDPPFDSHAVYAKKVTPRGAGETDKLLAPQYRDLWREDDYLQFMYERLNAVHELLAEDGTLYLHCDWHRSHHLRCLLDEVFGSENFVNEIIWCYEDIGGRAVNYFKRKHDTVFMYQKSPARKFRSQRRPLSDSTLKRYGKYFDAEGKITYRWLSQHNPGVFKKLKGIPANLDQAWLDRDRGQPLSDWWSGISPLKSHFNEHVGYPTQKPEALLTRLLTAASDAGDLILDCFMGSGTVPIVAARMGRRFVGVDNNPAAVQTAVRRLRREVPDSGFGVYRQQTSPPHACFNLEATDGWLIIHHVEVPAALQSLRRSQPGPHPLGAVDGVLIDWNFDGSVFRPTLADFPDKKQTVAGRYRLPASSGNIRVRVIDVLGGWSDCCFVLEK